MLIHTEAKKLLNKHGNDPKRALPDFEQLLTDHPELKQHLAFQYLCYLTPYSLDEVAEFEFGETAAGATPSSAGLST